MQLRIHLQTESAEGPQIPERNDSESFFINKLDHQETKIECTKTLNWSVDGRFDEFYNI